MPNQITYPELIRPDTMGYIADTPFVLPTPIPFSINALLLAAFLTYGIGAVLIIVLLTSAERPDNSLAYWSIAGILATFFGIGAALLALIRLHQRRYRQGLPTKIAAIVCFLVNCAEAIICANFFLQALH